MENLKQWLKDFIHNCLVHPLLPFLPLKTAERLHRWNGDWTFNKSTNVTSVYQGGTWNI